MIRYLFITLTFCFILISCGKKKSDNAIIGLIIDKNIKTEVEKHISKSKDIDDLKDKMQEYDNSIFAELYENDSLYYNSYSYNSYNKIYIDKQFLNRFMIGKRIL